MDVTDVIARLSLSFPFFYRFPLPSFLNKYLGFFFFISSKLSYLYLGCSTGSGTENIVYYFGFSDIARPGSCIAVFLFRNCIIEWTGMVFLVDNLFCIAAGLFPRSFC